MFQAIADDSLPVSAAPRRLGRSVGAVFAGFATVFVLSTGTDAVLHATNVFPASGVRMSGGLFVLASAYRCAFTVLGGYVTARLAPQNAQRHALVLGCIGLSVATLAVVLTWRRSDLGPAWYPLMLAVTALPCTLAGGRLFRRA